MCVTLQSLHTLILRECTTSVRNTTKQQVLMGDGFKQINVAVETTAREMFPDRTVYRFLVMNGHVFKAALSHAVDLFNAIILQLRM